MRLWLCPRLCVSHWLHPVMRVLLESLRIWMDLLGGKRRPIYIYHRMVVVHVMGRRRNEMPDEMMVGSVVVHWWRHVAVLVPVVTHG
jgi:hypothetical protein